LLVRINKYCLLKSSNYGKYVVFIEVFENHAKIDQKTAFWAIFENFLSFG